MPILPNSLRTAKPTIPWRLTLSRNSPTCCFPSLLQRDYQASISLPFQSTRGVSHMKNIVRDDPRMNNLTWMNQISRPISRPILARSSSARGCRGRRTVRRIFLKDIGQRKDTDMTLPIIAGEELPLLAQQAPKSLLQGCSTALRALLDPSLEGLWFISFMLLHIRQGFLFFGV